ncbi:phage tail protein [Halomonas sp. 1390]|uniref:phage tail protein n=1 Tax=Halomonas sp. B23F22_3 TaxID=3459516 RepID=UPI00373FC49E
MEPFIGQIQLFPYTFAPRGWAFCEGQELQIEQNTALFSLIGNTYGGDGRTTFALPDLKTKNLDGNLHYCIALQGVYPSRD